MKRDANLVGKQFCLKGIRLCRLDKQNPNQDKINLIASSLPSLTRTLRMYDPMAPTMVTLTNEMMLIDELEGVGV